ncbi:MAG: NADPH-dependent assimilatory sulfite reductase hemoprotein subunit [Verrucomicrobiota bacterium]|nr:NADPH-dependent assimilatory sulfite reductase hemoprotein subunit [Verrucomicrobiota bacterium]
MISEANAPAPRSKNEDIKEASHFLRGTLKQEFADTTTAYISEDSSQLLKFHGSYMQDDRDLRNERRRQKLDKAWIFMTRVRVPGGVATPAQWLKIDALSDKYANGTIKLTTRQAFQLHGILKHNLKPTVQEINAALLDTLAACGDVNRNVMCNPNPGQSEAHAATYELSKALSKHLSPQSRAYYEVWLDEELVAGGEPEEVQEPIYGKYYLPRKFKIGIAVPPSNDVDIYSQDLGFIAILEGGKIIGYNVTVGGGMGMSHGQPDTFPRLADALGFCTPEQAVAVAEKVLIVQRDYGDRTNRKHARLKYTIQDRGIVWFRQEVEARLGFKLQPSRDFTFDGMGDRYGWVDGLDGRAHLTLFIQNGRVRDDATTKARTGLREIAKVHDGDFRLTANQNLIIANVSAANRPKIEALLKEYKLDNTHNRSALRLNSMACVALPTCGLSLAESERYLPDLIDELDTVLDEAGLTNDAITVRMTGCPNGCARPYLAEIGFVGRAPGKYNLYLGAAFNGTRLNTLYKESVTQEQIRPTLAPILNHYARERTPGERFGDFVIRTGYVKGAEK